MPFPVKDAKKKGARLASVPYGAAAASYNPYENRPRAETAESEEPRLYEAPAPLSNTGYETEAAMFPGGARPSPAQRTSGTQAYTPVPYQPYACGTPLNAGQPGSVTRGFTGGSLST